MCIILARFDNGSSPIGDTAELRLYEDPWGLGCYSRHWTPFAKAFGAFVLVNAALAAMACLGNGWAWLALLMIITVPFGLVRVIYAFLKGLAGSPAVRTLFCLVMATIFSVVVTLLFPFIVAGLAIFLRLKRQVKVGEMFKGVPDLYEFLIMNIYPIFFAILPEFFRIVEKGREEKKSWKGGMAPEMRSSVELDHLQTGDVVLTGVDSWSLSVPIQASNILSSSEEDRYWTHAAIYRGDGEVIEAQSDGRGVTITKLADYYFRNGSRIRVFRHRYLDPSQLQPIVDYCQSRVDQKCGYDTWAVSFYALTALMPPMLSGWLEGDFAEKVFNVKDSYFCSELVAEAFRECGQDMFNRHPWRVKPLDFAYTPLLEEVDCDFKQWEASGAAV